MYQRYWGGNMDEGWTRWLFDTFELPYTTLRDEDINEDLGENYDVVILPSDVPPMMLGLEEADTDEYPYLERILRWIGSVDSVPPEYRSGFGEDGAEALQKFVAEGGRLVALDRATELVIDQFDLNVKNAVAELDKKTFFSHGNTLRVEVDTGHPLAYGMPEEAFVLSWDSPTFELLETQRPEDYSVVARYPKQDVLQSGWLIGEDKIAGKPALLHVKQDEGELVLVGFRTQHRGQMHGTFKFLFNCLF
jgi:hypothetical protein